MKSDNEIRLQSQIAQREQLIRHLFVTLKNTVNLLERVREYVPNQIEWDNMLDGLHRTVDTAENVAKYRRSGLVEV